MSTPHPNQEFDYRASEGKSCPPPAPKPKSLLERIRDHNAVNREVDDPVGYPDLCNHPARA